MHMQEITQGNQLQSGGSSEWIGSRDLCMCPMVLPRGLFCTPGWKAQCHKSPGSGARIIRSRFQLCPKVWVPLAWFPKVSSPQLFCMQKRVPYAFLLNGWSESKHLLIEVQSAWSGKYQMEAAFLSHSPLPSSIPLIPSSQSSSCHCFLQNTKVIWLNEMLVKMWGKRHSRTLLVCVSWCSPFRGQLVDTHQNKRPQSLGISCFLCLRHFTHNCLHDWPTLYLRPWLWHDFLGEVVPYCPM